LINEARAVKQIIDKSLLVAFQTVKIFLSGIAQPTEASSAVDLRCVQMSTACLGNMLSIKWCEFLV